LSNALAYVDSALKAGLDIDLFAPRLSFFFAAHNNLFEEVAKFRAARRIWANIMKEKYGARSEKSMLLRFHTQTGGSTLTAQQPENNIIRTTIQALAAVLGGTQSLHTNSFDEALALPSEKAAEIALRTQQIIGYESGVVDSADPLGGSYLVEYMTDEIENKINEIMDIVEQRGGSVRCVDDGYFRNEIALSAYQHQKNIENNETVVVGVNRFETVMESPPDILKVDPELEIRQVKKLNDLRKNRDNNKVEKCINNLDEVARGEDNIVLPIIEAVENYATLGEIADCLRSVWGEYHEAL